MGIPEKYDRLSMKEIVEQLLAHLDILAPFVWTQDGVFSFPDGERLEGCAHPYTSAHRGPERYDPGCIHCGRDSDDFIHRRK